MRSCSIRGCEAPATCKATGWDNTATEAAIDTLAAAGLIQDSPSRTPRRRGPHIRILCDWHGQQLARDDSWKITPLPERVGGIRQRERIDIRGALERIGKLTPRRTEA